MTRSLAAVYSGAPGRLELQSLETPAPRYGEVLVHVLGCTLCGSDLHSFCGRRAVPTPTILGHEIVGRIVALGDGAPTHDLAGAPIGIGSRVTWAIVANCSTCYYCERGLPQKCLRAVKYGHEAFRPGEELLGGAADHCLLVRGTSIVAIPESLSLAAACPASCATATIAAALEAAGPLANASVCVLGAGMLGLNACAMARHRGAARVACVDLVPERRERALRFGADAECAPDDLPSFRKQTGLIHGFDVVLELTGDPRAFEAAWPHVRMGGVLMLVGAVFPSTPLALPMEQVVRRQLSLKGIHNYSARHLLEAVQFLEQTHQIHPWDELVSDWFPLGECQKAFEHAHQSGAIRVGVRGASAV